MKNTVNNTINKALAKALPNATHYNFAFPWDKPGAHLLKGQGHFVEDVDGNSYIDFFSKFGAAFLGHSNTRYIEHLSAKLHNSLTAVDHFGDDERRIVEKLLTAVPGSEQVRFSLSGTEAVQNAFRAARAYTGKDKIIRFMGHYHGNADTILGGMAHAPSFMPVEQPGDARGTAGRASHAFDATLLLPWNNWEALEAVLADHDDIAAVIMEPICINGGGLLADADYLARLKAASIARGFLIIFDEVITGFRLGYGSAQNRLGIAPDIWIFGKAVSGGSLPVSCFMANSDIMRQYATKKTTHGGTFNGYALGLHAIDITLDILSESGLYERVTSHARQLQAVLLEYAQKHGVDLVIQGDPLAMCLHAGNTILTGGDQWTPEMKEKEAIIREAFMAFGVMIAPPCRLYPSIALDDAVITATRQRADDIFNQVKESYERAGYAR